LLNSCTIKSEIKEVFATVFDALNQGQQKKILKNEKVKTLFDRYGVEYGADAM
jgi:hypothetical protein